MIQLTDYKSRQFLQRFEKIISVILFFANIVALIIHIIIQGQTQYLLALTILNIFMIILSISYFIYIVFFVQSTNILQSKFDQRQQQQDIKQQIIITIFTIIYIQLASIYAGFDLLWIFQTTTQFKGLDILIQSSEYKPFYQAILLTLILICIGLIVLINFTMRFFQNLQDQYSKPRRNLVLLIITFSALIGIIFFVILYSMLSKRSQNGITKIITTQWILLLVTAIFLIIILCAYFILVIRGQHKYLWYVSLILILFTFFFIGLLSLIHRNFMKEIQKMQQNQCFQYLKDYSQTTLNKWGCEKKYLRNQDQSLVVNCYISEQSLVWQQQLIQKYGKNLGAPYIVACLNGKCCQIIINCYGPLLIKLGITGNRIQQGCTIVFLIMGLILFTTGISNSKKKRYSQLSKVEIIIIVVYVILMIVISIIIGVIVSKSTDNYQIIIKRNK